MAVERTQIGKDGVGGTLAIDPEFEILKRVPVPKDRFAVRIVQRLWRNLPNKQLQKTEVQVNEIQIPSPSAPGRFVRTLCYADKDVKEGETLPCVLLLHGGAFLFPAFPYHYRLAKQIVQRIRCRVIMPMYDLAPDFVPPLQQEEVFECYQHILFAADYYSIDPGRIAVIGDSAGGTLTAALTLMARDRNVPMPIAQELFYPSLDRRLESDSMKRYRDVPVCNGDSIQKYYKMCRSDEYVGNPDYISPVEAESLEGLPEAYVETAEFDALHDDGIAYAKRLKEAGCRVVLNETKGTVHGFDIVKSSRILARVIDQRIAFLQKVLSQDVERTPVSVYNV